MGVVRAAALAVAAWARGGRPRGGAGVGWFIMAQRSPSPTARMAD